MKKRLRAHVVSQTHWDREWYLPLEEFRFHLVRLMDRVFHLFDTQPGYRHFVSDGQTIILEDYLAIKPEMEEVVRRRVQEGRLVIGPWYILPDEFIVSAESLVRNLQMGRRVAKRFGRPSKAGYVPDPFGHVAQLPQILKGFELDNFIFLRGMPPAKTYGTEFEWEAPDGSRVLAIWMKNIYFNASLLGYESGWGDSEQPGREFSMDRAMEQIEGQYKDLGEWTRCGVILLNNGCDHTFPQFELPDVIKEAGKRFPDVAIEHTNYDAFIADVKKRRPKELAVMKGELRSSCYIVILPGVLSTRMYLKKWNRRCEFLLEKWAEPVCAWMRHLGERDEQGFLLEAWRLLLQNHPHDSICGCSVDAVHREMVTRFEKVEQIATSVRDRALGLVEQRIDTRREGAKGALVLWNPLPGARRGSARSTVTFPADFAVNYRLVDSEGNDVPFQKEASREYSKTEYLRFNALWRDETLHLERDAAGWGYETLWLMPGRAAKTDDWSRRAQKAAIETDHYRLRFRDNGSFDLYDKATRTWHRRQLIFENTEDVGDEYDYSPAKNSKTFTTENLKARIRIERRGPVFVDYAIAWKWRLPAEALADRTGRSKKTEVIDLNARVRVYRRHRRIDVAVSFDNRIKDHRMRVLFDGPRAAKHSEADGHYAIVQRPFTVATTREHDTPEPVTHHMRHFVALRDGTAGLAVLNRDLLEYEVLQTRGRKTLAVTVLRSVGWLSKDDLISRPTFAGPQIATPEAQCPGPCETEFALLPFAKDLAGEVVPEAESFAAPALLRFTDLHEGDMPTEKRVVRLDRDDVVWSTWKPAEERSGSVMRFYNPAGRKQQVRVQLDNGLRLRAECNLREKTLAKIKKKDAGKKRELPAFAIKSYRIE